MTDKQTESIVENNKTPRLGAEIHRQTDRHTVGLLYDADDDDDDDDVYH